MMSCEYRSVLSIALDNSAMHASAKSAPRDRQRYAAID
jgi:hypothetical protein